MVILWVQYRDIIDLSTYSALYSTTGSENMYISIWTGKLFSVNFVISSGTSFNTAVGWVWSLSSVEFCNVDGFQGKVAWLQGTFLRFPYAVII